MEGAPGHQAGTLARTVRRSANRPASGRLSRSLRRAAPNVGWLRPDDRVVGGLWDSMLGEGRRFWIVATSDSHAHYADSARPGSDFWPGEYPKTYAHAQRSYQGCSMRFAGTHVRGRRRPHHRAGRAGGSQAGGTAGIGETLSPKGTTIDVRVTFRDPQTTNTHGDNPRVARVDSSSARSRRPRMRTSIATRRRRSSPGSSRNNGRAMATLHDHDDLPKSTALLCARSRDEHPGCRAANGRPRGEARGGSVVLLEPDLRGGRLTSNLAVLGCLVLGARAQNPEPQNPPNSRTGTPNPSTQNREPPRFDARFDNVPRPSFRLSFKGEQAGCRTGRALPGGR